MCFEEHKELLSHQYENPNWIKTSGVSLEDLMQDVDGIENAFQSKMIIKAKTFELIANKAQIAIDKEDIFQDKILGGNIMPMQRNKWERIVKEKYLSKEAAEIRQAWDVCGAYQAHTDFGHVSPNSKLLLDVGFVGLLKNVETASQREGLTIKQKEFYQSCKIVLNALITIAKRLADAIKPYNENNYQALIRIAQGKPQHIYDAMQLLILYFFAHEKVAGARVRTLGRLDVLLYPFYKKDIEGGVYTKEEIKEMLKFFLYKFWSAHVPYDLPFCLGGIDEDGNEVTNELSYLIVETYNELNIYSPKIHIRTSEKTPESFIKLVLSCIRKGNSSFVFVNDKIGIECLRRVGVEETDARNFVPIGCYEPAVWGVEVGCTGNGGVNLAKAVEFVITNGMDFKSGIFCGVKTGKITTYQEFIEAIKIQIAHMTKKMMDFVAKIEKYYIDIYPDAILSCQYEESIKKGVDVYEGGAKYNNSSIYFWGVASLVDSISAVRKLVFENKIFTFDELGEMLKVDWVGYEKERNIILNLSEKYGNNSMVADEIMVEMADFCASISNNKPNGRGGVFKAALISIDECFRSGARTMATPDGRRAGEPVSKNLCSTAAMDKEGITSLIRSVTKIDLANFPTGSVLDIVLHPTSVEGEEGLNAFYAIIKTYFDLGGFAMHGNIFNVNDLRAAQENPEKYKTLQVRVCGWNAYFVDLSKVEQDTFIKQTEHVS